MKNVKGSGGNGLTFRESAMEAARHKVRQLAAEGRTVEEIERALAGEGLTDLERNVAYLLATHEVGRVSTARRDAPGRSECDEQTAL
jgi:hypothetical protein